MVIIILAVKMTMTTIRRTVLVLLIAASINAVRAQDRDFGIWYNIAAAHEFTKKIDAEIAATIRTFDKASRIEEGFIEGELSYKIFKFLSASVAYRITENIEDDDNYYIRHKWFAGLKGDIEIWDLELSGRLRYQQRFKTYFEDEEDKIPDSHVRLKLKTTYKTPSFPLNPFVEAEIFCPVFKESDILTDKKRFTAGIEYKISKSHSVEAEYMFQRDYKPDLTDDHIISLDYKFTF